MSTSVRIGISTCPNDTFAFHGLLTGRVEVPGVELDFELADVEELNRGVLEGRFDIAKVSFHLALRLARDLVVLPSGAALGFGNGPLLLSGGSKRAPGPDDRVLCPGENTTAALLFRLFHPGAAEPHHVVFSEIMPALEAGEADFGVCIHEGRFTYDARGLTCIEDLGRRWEETHETPLPLGGIVARRSLDPSLARRVQEGLRRSLRAAQDDRASALATMRRYAAEQSDEALWKHVELYVNEWTHDLGDVGRSALTALGTAARDVGIATDTLEVLEL